MYHSFQLFQVNWEQKLDEETVICIEFQRRVFIDMMHWIEQVRRTGFNGRILLSMQKEDFDYGVIPKFLACGGDYVIEYRQWYEDPLLLEEGGHDESVLEWLHNSMYQCEYSVEDEQAVKHLYQELIDHESDSIETLSYVYNGLTTKRRDELAGMLRQKVRRIGNKLVCKPAMTGIKDGVITIWNNPEFCCELGIQMAKRTGKRVLIVDLDRLNPTFDVHCPLIKKGNKGKRASLGDVQRLHAMNQLSDETLSKLCYPVKGASSMRVLYGCSELKKFEYFTNEALIEAIAIFRRSYDVVLLHVNQFIYDAYTCLAIIKSDCVLMPIDGYLTTIRAYQRSLALLCEKQKVVAEKFYYVFFECDEAFVGEMNLLSEMLKRPIVGWISACKKRRYCRNLKRAYGLCMRKKITLEYKDLIAVLVA
ncbi:MAG: hypothetical protein JXO44_02970 [Clostridia bacterium]|nr:hypothetical protein [Clostridia bacterium]